MKTYSVSLTRDSEAIARAEAAGKAGEVRVDISRDSAPRSLNPAELLLAAFGGCLLKNIGKLAPKMRLVLDDVRGEMTGIRTESPPRIAAIRYELTILTEEPVERIGRLIGYLREYGTVYNTLTASVEVTEEVVLERADGTRVRVGRASAERGKNDAYAKTNR